MSGPLMAASGDAFVSGAVLGIATGFLMGLVFRSWLVWRIRSRAWKGASLAAGQRQASLDRVAANGHRTPERSAGPPIA